MKENVRGKTIMRARTAVLQFWLSSFCFHLYKTLPLNKQGHDEGTRYRTGIYYTDAADLPVIDSIYAEEQALYDQPLVVERQPLDKNPDGYCHLPTALFAFAKKAKEKVRG